MLIKNYNSQNSLYALGPIIIIIIMPLDLDLCGSEKFALDRIKYQQSVT